MKPNLNKDQRKRLFLLARLLDRVPRKKFNITEWVSTESGKWACPHTHTADECGYAGCAIGWGMTNKVIRGNAGNANELSRRLGCEITFDGESDGDKLFGPQRGTDITPKRVAADIRQYLKDGTLPTS